MQIDQSEWCRNAAEKWLFLCHWYGFGSLQLPWAASQLATTGVSMVWVGKGVSGWSGSNYEAILMHFVPWTLLKPGE